MSEDAIWATVYPRKDKIICSHEMLAVYGEYLGLAEVLAIEIVSALGVSMNRADSPCVAVIGAIIVLSLTYEGDNPSGGWDLRQLVWKFIDRFIARHGSISCNDLRGNDIKILTSMGSTIHEKELWSILCPQIDHSSAEIVRELLAEREMKRPITI